MSEMCCTIAEICRVMSSQKRHVLTVGKSLLNSTMSSTCPHNMLNLGALTAEIGWWVWGIQQISTGFTSWLRYCTDVAQRRSTKLCTMFGRLLGWYTIYTFLGLLLPNEILPGSKFTSLAFSYIGSVTVWHSSSGRQTNSAPWYKKWNYGTFAPHRFQQRAPPILRGRPSRWAYAHILILNLGLLDLVCKTTNYNNKVQHYKNSRLMLE